MALSPIAFNPHGGEGGRSSARSHERKIDAKDGKAAMRHDHAQVHSRLTLKVEVRLRDHRPFGRQQLASSGQVRRHSRRACRPSGSPGGRAPAPRPGLSRWRCRRRASLSARRPPGDVGIAAGFAERDLAQLAPHRFLEGGAVDVDRQLGRRLRALDRLPARPRPRAQSCRRRDGYRHWGSGAEGRFRPRQTSGGKCPSASPRPASGPSGLSSHDIADRLAAAAVAPGRRGHSQPLLGIGVKAARRRHSRRRKSPRSRVLSSSSCASARRARIARA